MSKKLPEDDPAYWMLERGRIDPEWRSIPTVRRSGCYICQDDEYSLMGLPLCYPCRFCKGHVPADDTVCDDCDKDNHPDAGE